MFNPDLKELLKDANSRYSLVIGTAKRAREIQEDNLKEKEMNKDAILDEKVVSMAIDEILAGKYIIEEPDELKAKNK